ncbi:heterogeneous nuclear ribonucleoprotein Q-like [Acanthaster planci]|uniref:Heterogeneous nuclear ribonucleoprotein Q-like n=1 Tax=Acanthaster planci TaxID=133434 RepID=A0A8B7XMN7_ACAPL|nr:heterogeneous nuclear ribonucleoprotein Q-like [Acanthaster planci]
MAEANGDQIPEEQQMDEEVQGETQATDEPMETETHVRTDNFDKYLGMGFSEKVAEKLDQIVTMVTDLTSQSEVQEELLDDRALEALKGLDDESSIAVLKQFSTSDLTHVNNKSAFICGVIKTFRQKSQRPGGAPAPDEHKGPDEAKIKEMLERTGYSLDVTTGQRKYGGPPPNWEGDAPGAGCEVFIGKIPKDTFEDVLVPLIEKCGRIYDFRLMMDPMSGLNRGYAFATFCTQEGAKECVKQLDGGSLGTSCNISIPKRRLFVGSVPKNKTKQEIKEEFEKVTAGLVDVIIYHGEDKTKNRGFAFLEYDSHRSASLARRQLMSGKVRVWNNLTVTVDWADPVSEPDEETMSKVKVAYVRNLAPEATEEVIQEHFKQYGEIEKVKKMKDYCFIHFTEREYALKAIEETNGTTFHGLEIEASLAKPRQENIKKKQRQMKQQQGYQGGRYYDDFYGPMRGGRGRGGLRGRGGFDRGERGYRDFGYGGGYDEGYYGGYPGGYDDPFNYEGYYGSGYDGFGYGGRGQGMGPRGRGGPRGGRGGMGGPRGGPAIRAGPRGGRARGGQQQQRGGRGGSGNRGGRGGNRGGNVSGKRKFEGQQPGDTKRRNTQGGWGVQPIAQQPLGEYSASYDYNQSYGDQSWSQDNYGSGF